MSIEEEKIEALTKELARLREELTLMPDRIVEKLRQDIPVAPGQPVHSFVGYSTTIEASRKLGISLPRIRQLLIQGILPGKKNNDGKWLILNEDLDQYHPPGRGRPHRRATPS